MIRNFTADYVFPIVSEPIKNGVVSVDENGEILGIYSKDQASLHPGTLEKLSGIIVPGFVNSHCHLELSYLRDKIPAGNGLVSFVQDVIETRKQPVDDSDIAQAMQQADKEMRGNGIVATGDISNTSASVEVKQGSPIYYHSFIELLGFSPTAASAAFEKGNSIKAQFNGLPASIVPHAPYTVSKELFRLIRKKCEGGINLLSMHNQESEEENKFYRYKKGRFVELYDNLDQNIDFFKPQARNSIQTVIPLIEESTPILLVHNTYTTVKDISFVRRFGRNITWCFCPKANLYIENRLPKIDIFLDHPFDIVLGTDSLASNDKLCILSEMMVIQEHFPNIPLPQLLKWATMNGAKFLGIDDLFGSLEKGKKPGLNLISEMNGFKFTEASKVTPLV
ncbi:MAG TPA: amidohydrolase family protein [Sphingobacteriaceae bacterium]